jgi:hypothetical protein
MTVVELMGLAQGEANSAMMLSDGSLATLTGYLLIAYFIGAKLTFFQVTLSCTFHDIVPIRHFVFGRNYHMHVAG